MKWGLLCGIALSLIAVPAIAQTGSPQIDARVAAVEQRVIAWRRDIHQHPELGNRETRTAALVARHLRQLGFDEVRTGIAQTGVVGVLKGARPGKVVALRADMDALPVKEATGLPFASQVIVDVNGVKTPIMHACGHDAHVAMLMGAAEVLAGMRGEIAGTVVMVFQPAEEGVAGEEAGAKRMLREGVFASLKPNAIFAAHVEPGQPGRIDVRPGPFLASSSSLHIRLNGRQTHGGRPWEGTDLVNLGADVVKGLSTLAARQFDVFAYPNVISIGAFRAGNRVNILPGEATLDGTVRTFDNGRRDAIKQGVTRLVEGLAAGYQAKAEIRFVDENPVTANDPALLDVVLPALQEAAGHAGVNRNAQYRAASEDFSYFAGEVPSVYYIIGSTPSQYSAANAPTNHSDRFDIDEAVLAVGVKAHVLTTLAVLRSSATP